MFVIEQIPILFTIIISDLYSDLCAHMYACVGKNDSLVWGIQSQKLLFFPPLLILHCTMSILYSSWTVLEQV